MWQCQACAWVIPGHSGLRAPQQQQQQHLSEEAEAEGEEGKLRGGGVSLWCVYRSELFLCMDLCSSCLAPAKRCHLVPSPPTDTGLPTCLHVQASPMRPHSQGWLPCQAPWVRECQHWVGIRHQRNQNVTERCKTPLQRASPVVPLKYCMWYHSFVWLKVCQMRSLKGTWGPPAPEICRNAPFV